MESNSLFYIIPVMERKMNITPIYLGVINFANPKLFYININNNITFQHYMKRT